MPNKILPGFTIGILGGGQLGRMMAVAAKHMGYRIAVLDPTPDCPAAQVSDHHVQAAYDDLEAIKELAELSDVVTYEFENVDLEAARYLEEKGMLPQGANSLAITQDRENEKTTMADLDLPVAPFAIVNNEEEFKQAVQTLSYPCVVKTCRGGYDGKGQLKLTSEADVEDGAAFVSNNGRCIVEQWVSFDKEISVVFTRSIAGEITFFPIAENEHRNHILYKTTAPAHISETVKEKALAAAQVLAEGIEVVGTFTIEMFVNGEDIYLNEMAPRPHNSGHYTIEACNVSQFEQHVRAICGLRLIPIVFQGAAVMVNVLGQDMKNLMEQSVAVTTAHLHIYGKKESKQNRKMGHLTFVDTSIEELRKEVEQDLTNQNM